MKKYLIILVFVTAYVTHYTKESSCHYPKNGGCLTASGNFATAGITAACPRKYKFGTKIKVDGKMYECQDRLSKKYDSRFDIFADETLKQAFKWGKQLKQIEIIKN